MLDKASTVGTLRKVAKKNAFALEAHEPARVLTWST